MMTTDPLFDTAFLRQRIRTVPDWPGPGIQFRDITPLLLDPRAFRLLVEAFVLRYMNAEIDLVAGIDARGFILGSVVAHQLNRGFIPVRKKGKLPWQTRGIDYSLEYGTNSVEMHLDAISPGETVLLADDLLATGGTAAAALHLIEQAGGKVLGSTFFIELAFLGGREKVSDSGPVHALITY